MWTRKELKLRAKDGLNRNYWKAVLISAIFTLVFSGGSILTHKSDKLDDIIGYAFINNPFLVIFTGLFGFIAFALFIILIVFLGTFLTKELIVSTLTFVSLEILFTISS